MPFSKCNSEMPPVFLPPASHHIMVDGQRKLPLQGLTLLVVEDSRVTCDVMRLMCQRLGARLRRAETLRAAQEHLKVYRPDVVIIDLGLPDGRGETLIRELALSTPRIGVILGTSGDVMGRIAALAAGANGFLEKPIESIAAFQTAILRHLSGHQDMTLVATNTAFTPDPLALHDDLLHAADLLTDPNPNPAQAKYLVGFVNGLALVAHDAALGQAAQQAQNPQGRLQLADMLAAKLAQGSVPQIVLPPDQGAVQT